MLEHLRAVFSRAQGVSDGLIEISWTDARAPHKLNAGELFPLNDLERAAAHAERLNADPNRNVYLSAGLRRAGTYLHSRGEDVDIDEVTACWADFDNQGALATALQVTEALDLAPNLVTFTGREPHLRGQMWWILDAPSKELATHRLVQRSLAAKLGGDTTVINPSRVMRLIGSVAWPLKAGRVLEMTGVLAEEAVRVAPYKLEEIVAALTAAEAMISADAPLFRASAKPSATVLDFNGAEPVHDLDSLIARAAEPSQWHRHALLAVAHLLGRGTPPDVVVDMLTTRLQQPGYTYPATRQEIVVMTEGGIRRGLYRERAVEAVEPETPKESPFKTLRQLLEMPRPEWMIADYLPERSMSALFAPPGAFKSFLALDMAMCVAYGLPWHGFATKQRRALYICAEGQYDFATRLLVWAHCRAHDVETDQFFVLPVPVNFLDAAKADLLIEAIGEHLGGVGLVVIDTLARNFGPGDENSTKDMNAYVASTAKLVERGAHVMHVHHTGKDGSKGERGSSAFLGALDTSLMLERDGHSDVATLFVKKQKSAPEAKPLRLRFPAMEVINPTTGEVTSSLVPTLTDGPVVLVHPPRAAPSRPPSLKMLRIQQRLQEGPASLSELAVHLKANLQKTIIAMMKRGAVVTNPDGSYCAVVVSSPEKNQEDDE
ncbi:DNA helicase [alpha proteobacterium U9-1i]|nr:DNA helicase [alpha proteobacterium U9-1i]